MVRHSALLFLLLISALVFGQNEQFTNETESEINERMAWWKNDRFGMFIHWGLYAIPAGEWKESKGHGEWIMTTAQIPVEEYEQLAAQFNPVNFDAEEWVILAKEAGMKYIVITSKHHDGFCLWDSKVTNYDIMDATPFKRDILKELSDACKKHNIKFCLYHSIMDWHHPDYLPRRKWENRSSEGADYHRYIQYMKAQLEELITGYDPDVLWFDGEWEDTWTHEEGLKLYNYVRSLKPEIIINNRVDKGRQGMQGLNKDGNFAGDFGTPEQEIPPTGLPGVNWESCMTMNNTWGYSKGDQNWKSTSSLILKTVDIVSKGGNYLLNVGPTAEGNFPSESITRLKEIGAWMNINSEAIYGATAYAKADYTQVFETFMHKRDAVIDFDWGTEPPRKNAAADHFFVTWTGEFSPSYSETYTLSTLSDDGVRLWVDDKLIIDNYTDHGPTLDSSIIDLNADQNYELRLDYYEKTGGATIKLFWESETQSRQIIPAEAFNGGLTGIFKQEVPKSLYYTQKGEVIYAISTKLPEEGLILNLKPTSTKLKISLLGTNEVLNWKPFNSTIAIDLSQIDRKTLQSEHAHVFKIEGLFQNRQE